MLSPHNINIRPFPGIWENKDEIVDVAMQIINGIAAVTEKMKAAIRREIKQLVDAGKMNMFNMYSKVKALIQKYNPLSDGKSFNVMTSTINRVVLKAIW